MSRRTQENLVLLGVLVVFIAAIVACMGYGPRARVVPLPIASLGAILTVAQLILQNLPSVGDLHLDALELFTSQPMGAAKPAGGNGGRRRNGSAPDETRWKRELLAVGIVLLLTGMFLLIGPIPSIFLFTSGYLLIRRQYNAPLCIIVAALFTLVIYVLFVVILGVQIDGSILGSMFGF